MASVARHISVNGPLVRLLLTIIAVTGAKPLDNGILAVHESIAAIPPGFAHAGSVPADQELTLRIALAHSDIEGLQAQTYAVSDPANKLYGNHLSVEEALKFVRPTPLTNSTVSAWLSSHGITPTPISPAGDILQITLPVATANELLGAQFESFTHVESGATSIRTLGYSVPVSLQEHIQYVHPTVAFVPPLQAPPSVKAVEVKRDGGVTERAAGVVAASCATTMSPACIEALYDFPTGLANNSAQNLIGVAGYAQQFANFADVAMFVKNLLPGRPASNFTVVQVDSGRNDQTITNAGVEADLDMEMVALAGGVPATFISVGARNLDNIDGFIDIVNTILAMPIETRPTVLSTSYGFNEQDLPFSLVNGMCNAYMQLGAVGISVLFASGDGGVSGMQDTTCDTFVPSAPGGCQFITSVGGSTGLPPQVAAPLSGGGFSNFFPIPDYQASDVTIYLASMGDKYAGLYNSAGRGMPDVALQAMSVEYVREGTLLLDDGTSFATPIFAAMIALLNDRLIAAGKPVLGFLNPFLYSPKGRAAFTDVTSGSNPGCGTNGFSAGPGWDPVTGLGTPNFSQLLTALGL
ncbi:family S53 protease [Mycena haematopus]|nr:family S53 protease [Mycena haematopus]